MIRVLRFCLLLLIFLVNSGFSLFAQEYPIDQKSPQSAVFKHFYYLQDAHFQPEKAASFGNASASNQELAIQLKQIYDSRGFKPDFSSIPSDPDFTDTLINKQQYVPEKGFPVIYLVSK